MWWRSRTFLRGWAKRAVLPIWRFFAEERKAFKAAWLRFALEQRAASHLQDSSRVEQIICQNYSFWSFMTIFGSTLCCKWIFLVGYSSHPHISLQLWAFFCSCNSWRWERMRALLLHERLSAFNLRTWGYKYSLWCLIQDLWRHHDTGGEEEEDDENSLYLQRSASYLME